MFPTNQINPTITQISKEELKNLVVNYGFQNTQFGLTLIASTSKGICFVGFYENQNEGINELKSSFPTAELINDSTIDINFESLNFHLKCTDFQLKVWKSLLTIPYGSLRNYGQIAAAIQQPKASRAVGTAIGRNPIAFFIPCHRVVQATGDYGQYRWGNDLKAKMILSER
jgi:AraC family transcriptional regulator of adaptative response/methylated-DNA-[protein]-cysteine methyltransferase